MIYTVQLDLDIEDGLDEPSTPQALENIFYTYLNGPCITVSNVKIINVTQEEEVKVDVKMVDKIMTYFKGDTQVLTMDEYKVLYEYLRSNYKEELFTSDFNHEKQTVIVTRKLKEGMKS